MGSHTSRAAPGDARRLLDALRRIVRALRHSAARAEQETGLSGAQLFALQQFRGTEALSVGELAERTFTHQSSVSVVAQRLVEAGLLRRGRARDDGRRAELRPTARGLRLLARSPDVVQQDLVSAVARLGKSERRLLAGGLEALAGGMGLPAAPAGMFFEEQPRRSRGG